MNVFMPKKMKSLMFFEYALLLCLFYSPVILSGSDEAPDFNKEVIGEKLYIKNACASCHGPGGKQPIFSHYPILAGQQEKYLISQFQDIVRGKRNNRYAEQMRLVVSELKISKTDIYSISTWLATVPSEAKTGFTSTTGAQAYQNRKCATCHGPKGLQPLLPGAPKLASNNADYLFNQLLSFQSGERQSAVMSGIVKSISEQELKSIALWLGRK